jgi:hypothetical protein
MELYFTCLGHAQHRTPATQSGDTSVTCAALSFFTCSLFRTFETEACRTKPRSSAPLLQKGSTHDCSSSCDAAPSSVHPCDVSRSTGCSQRCSVSSLHCRGKRHGTPHVPSGPSSVDASHTSAAPSSILDARVSVAITRSRPPMSGTGLAVVEDTKWAAFGST